MEIIMSTKYTINNSVEVNELEDELVIVIPQTEKMYYCNRLARDIFYLIRDGLTVQQIIGFLLEKFDVEEEILKSDVEEIIEKLMTFQVIILEDN